MQTQVVNFVFDFGAVVFEWDPVKRVEKYFSSDLFGFETAQALAKNIFGHQTWHEFDQGLVSISAVISSTSKRLSIGAQALRELIEPIGEDLEPIKSSLRVLELLRYRRERGEMCRLFFLSNMPEPFARVLEVKHPFLNWFDAGIFSADVKLAKPDRQIYQLLAKENHLNPERTLFIDDQILNVQAAESMGWRGLHLTHPSELTEKIKFFL